MADATSWLGVTILLGVAACSSTKRDFGDGGAGTGAGGSDAGGAGDAGVGGARGGAGGALGGSGAAGDHASGGVSGNGGGAAGGGAAGGGAAGGEAAGSGGDAGAGGSAACPDSAPTRCNGTCVATSDDPGNCGRCEHSCQGGVCAAGACGAKALVATGVFYPSALAVDNTSVYWLEAPDANANPSHGSLKRTSLSGGSATTLANSQCGPEKLALSSAGLFWINTGSDCTSALTPTGLVSLPAGATSAVPVAATYFAPVALSVDSTRVYWIDGAPASGSGVYDETLLTLPLTGLSGTPGVTLSAAAAAVSMTITPDALFWLQTGGFAHDGMVMTTRLNALSAGVSVLPAGTTLNGSYSEARIASDATMVYFGAQDANNVPFLGAAPLAGGSLTELIPGADPAGIAVDADYVYWTDQTTMAVSTQALAGGNVITLASGQANPYDIAIDANAVYWVNNASPGSVMKVAKP